MGIYKNNILSSNHSNKTLLTYNNLIFSKNFNSFYIFIYFFKSFIYSFFSEKIFLKESTQLVLEQKNISEYVQKKKKINFFFKYYKKSKKNYVFEEYLYFYYNF